MDQFSLLSILYKLASAAVSKRLNPVLQRLIGKQQNSYVSENNIGCCIMNIINMIHHCCLKQKLILLVHFRKAFDSISSMKVVVLTRRTEEPRWCEVVWGGVRWGEETKNRGGVRWCEVVWRNEEPKAAHFWAAIAAHWAAIFEFLKSSSLLSC